MRISATELLGGDFLAGHRLNNARTGDEHLCLASLNDEVGQRWRVGSATSTWTCNDGNLRHQTGEPHVVVKDLAVARQRVNPLLNASTTGVVDKHERSAVVGSSAHGGRNLAGLRFTSGATHDREVLGGHVHCPAENRGSAGDHTVGRRIGGIHAEVGGAVSHEHAGFTESALVDEGVDTLAGSHLPTFVLLGLAGFTATGLNTATLSIQIIQALRHRGIDARRDGIRRSRLVC